MLATVFFVIRARYAYGFMLLFKAAQSLVLQPDIFCAATQKLRNTNHSFV